MGTASAHFGWSEFACRDGCGWRRVDKRLLQGLEKLREELGRPIRIVSGRRCPEHNASVGGASRSRHVYGDAADIPSSLGVRKALAIKCGFTGIGLRDGIVVHVDTRPTAEPQVWTY